MRHAKLNLSVGDKYAYSKSEISNKSRVDDVDTLCVDWENFYISKHSTIY